MSKIRFKNSEVLPKVAQVVQVVNPKNTISILENVVLQQYNGFLYLTASDGETWLSTKATVNEIDEDVKCCINALRLHTALKSLKNDMEIEVDLNPDTHIAKFTYTSGNFELPFVDADDFPKSSSADETDSSSIDIEKTRFFNGIDLTEFATDTDSLHPQFNGIHIDFIFDETSNTMTMVFVGTDTRKLVRYTEFFNIEIEEHKEMFEKLNGKGFTLPKKSAIIINQLLAINGNETGCIITFNESHFKLICEHGKLSTRLISGRFPNYNAVIPTDFDKQATVDKDNFISALKRVMSFANQKTLMATLEFGDNKVVFSAEDFDYNISAQETMECEYSGDNILIGFPCNGLIDVVKNIRSEKVVIKMKEPSRAALIIPDNQSENSEYVSIQMPMQV